MPNPITPVYNPNGGFRWWKKSEIYTGPFGTGRFVPNVDDAVMDWDTGVYRVVAVDINTGLSTLSFHQFLSESGPTDEDIFIGGGPGPISESFRIYLDDSVVPHTLTIDGRIRMYSSAASYYKVFLGTDISINGQIISAYYNQSNILQGENVPFDSITVPNISNAPIKMPRIGYTNQSMVDGEVVTVVAYNDVGQAISMAKFIVKNTAFIRQTDAGQVYITGIRLSSPFLSQNNNRLLEYPINVTLQSVPMKGIVTYSNGQEIEMPVDGSKFTLYGRDQFVSTILGQTIPLVLAYNLGPDEVNYTQQSASNNQICEDYQARTIEADGTYSVKLYIIPVWDGPLLGYHLEYYLYNLDRQQYFDVTPLIEVPDGAVAFNPLAYNIQQTVTVAVDLARVNGLFTEYRHVQSVKVSLLNPGNINNFYDTRWTVQYSSGQDPLYGVGLVAKCQYSNVNNWGVDITCGAQSFEDWLRRVYYAGKPLFNPATETDVDIVPNYFRLRASSDPNAFINNAPIPVTQWDTVFNISSNLLTAGQILYVDFIKRVGNTDLQMGTAGLPFLAVYVP